MRLAAPPDAKCSVITGKALSFVTLSRARACRARACGRAGGGCKPWMAPLRRASPPAVLGRDPRTSRSRSDWAALRVPHGGDVFVARVSSRAPCSVGPRVGLAAAETLWGRSALTGVCSSPSPPCHRPPLAASAVRLACICPRPVGRRARSPAVARHAAVAAGRARPAPALGAGGGGHGERARACGARFEAVPVCLPRRRRALSGSEGVPHASTVIRCAM